MPLNETPEDKMMRLRNDPDALEQFQANQYQDISPEQKRANTLNKFIRETMELNSGDSNGAIVEVQDDTEDGIALYFAEKNPNFRWVQAWGKWLKWDGKVWLNDEKLEVYGTIRKLIRNTTDSSSKIARTLRKSSTVASVEKLARCDERLIATSDQWDTDIFLLNTENGIVDLLNNKELIHDPLKYMTRMTACSVGDECPLWLNFLSEVTDGDQDLIDFLQRVIGYSLTGSVREHALFFFYGTGRNGKGVFLNTIVALLADYAGVASIEALMETKGDRHPTELASLMGKRLVIAQEVDEGVKWAEAKIKTLTGGDPITARYMRQDFFTFDPQFKLLIAGNHKPAFRSIDEALRSRLHLIPFTVTIPKEKRDPDLQDKLRDEWPGILRWAIDGAREYQLKGLQPPKAVTKATDEYFEDQDILRQWIADCCEVGKGYWETPTILFNSWKAYAKAANVDSGDSKAFKDNLEKAGYKQGNSRGRGGRFYDGIKIKPIQNDGYTGDVY